MSKRITLRLADSEYQHLAQSAKKNGTDLSTVARHFFLQNVALDQIKTEVSSLVQMEMLEVNAQLQVLTELITQLTAESVTKNDLKNAVNFITERIKK